MALKKTGFALTGGLICLTIASILGSEVSSSILTPVSPSRPAEEIRYAAKKLCNAPEKVAITDCRLSYLPRDYHRNERPYAAHVSAWGRLHNGTDGVVKGAVVSLRFLDLQGRLLLEEQVMIECPLEPGETSDLSRLWHAENNEFVSADPCDILCNGIKAGSVLLEATISQVRFTTPPASQAHSSLPTLSSEIRQQNPAMED